MPTTEATVTGTLLASLADDVPQHLRGEIAVASGRLPAALDARHGDERAPLQILVVPGEVVVSHRVPSAERRLRLAALRPLPPRHDADVRLGAIRSLSQRVACTLADPAHRWALATGTTSAFDVLGGRAEAIESSTYLLQPLHPHPHTARRAPAPGSEPERMRPFSDPSLRPLPDGAGYEYESSYAVAGRLARVRRSSPNAADAYHRCVAAACSAFAMDAMDPRRWLHADGSRWLPPDAAPERLLETLRSSWDGQAWARSRRVGGEVELIPAAWIHADVPGVLRCSAASEDPARLTGEVLLRTAESIVRERVRRGVRIRCAQARDDTDVGGLLRVLGVCDGLVLLARRGARGGIAEVSAGWSVEQAERRMGGGLGELPDAATEVEWSSPPPLGPLGPVPFVASLRAQGIRVWTCVVCPDPWICGSGLTVMVAVASAMDPRRARGDGR